MKVLTVSCILTGLIAQSFASEAEAPAKEERPLVQLALLLDTSNSMDGLIAQAKTQLWQIVNEFIAAKQDGKVPKVEVALFEYGNDGLPGKGGHIRLVSNLSDDLDKISESLFALKTGGGEEYCGWVIRNAVRDLKWNSSAKVYKAIFIAGNEEFTQGPVKYRESCKQAVEQGIIVNTIHCGDTAEGINGKWQDGAKLADGKFITIETNAQIAHVDAPQDKEIAELNAKLNDTYFAYGLRGAEGKMRQVQQDANAASAPAAPTVQAARAKTKASGNYSNSSWDALDAIKEGKLDLAKVKEEELPAEIRAVPADKRREFIAEKQKERGELQKQLRQLSDERDKYVATQLKDQKGGQRLDQAVAGAVRDQAAKKAFVFEQK